MCINLMIVYLVVNNVQCKSNDFVIVALNNSKEATMENTLRIIKSLCIQFILGDIFGTSFLDTGYLEEYMP